MEETKCEYNRINSPIFVPYRMFFKIYFAYFILNIVDFDITLLKKAKQITYYRIPRKSWTIHGSSSQIIRDLMWYKEVSVIGKD